MPLSSGNNLENVWKGIHHLFCQFKAFNYTEDFTEGFITSKECWNNFRKNLQIVLFYIDQQEGIEPLKFLV